MRLSTGKVKENVATDNLSRISSSHLLTMHFSIIDTDLVEKVTVTWQQDPILQALIQSLQDENSHPKFTWQQNMLQKKGKLVVENDSSLQQHIIKLFHDSPLEVI